MSPTRATVFAGRCCLALTLVCAAAAGVRARQQPPQAGGTDTKPVALPTAIHLVRQAQPGDRYTLKSSSHYNLLLRLQKEEQIDETNLDITETRTRTWRVRDVTAEGAITVEERTIEGKNTTVLNGERGGNDLPPEASLAVYQPDGKRASRKPLPPPQTGDAGAAGNTGDAGSAADDGPQTEPPLPAKALHVGDTWNGVFAGLPKDIVATPDISYKAKLTAIEVHQDVPCARVEYTLSAIDKNLPPLVSKKLSERAIGVGTSKMEGTITAYYTLDRGVIIDRQDRLTLTMKFNLTEPNPDTDEMDIHRLAQATIKLASNTKATKFPPYAPALVPSAVGTK